MELEIGKEYLVKEYSNWRILKLERINKHEYRFEYSVYIRKEDVDEKVIELNQDTVKTFKKLKMYTESALKAHDNIFRDYELLYNNMCEIKELNEKFPDYITVNWKEINNKLIEFKKEIFDIVNLGVEDIHGIKHTLHGSLEDNFDSNLYHEFAMTYPRLKLNEEE